MQQNNSTITALDDLCKLNLHLPKECMRQTRFRNFLLYHLICPPYMKGDHQATWEMNFKAINSSHFKEKKNRILPHQYVATSKCKSSVHEYNIFMKLHNLIWYLARYMLVHIMYNWFWLSIEDILRIMTLIKKQAHLLKKGNPRKLLH